MASLDIINEKKEKVGAVELAEPVLAEKVNKAVLYQAVKWTLSGWHHGTVRTKTRAEVLFTGKKATRQKGTGNARHGSMKTSPFVGGGRVFGPKPRDFTLGMPKKVRRLAVREALKSQLQNSGVVVLQDIPLKEFKTKTACRFFSNLEIPGGLLVLDGRAETVEKSIRNIKGFKIVRADQLNVVDILKYPKLIFTTASFEQVQKKYLS